MRRQKQPDYAYKNTEVPVERSIAQIKDLLYKHGAVGTQTTELPENHLVQFAFARRVNVNGELKQQPCRIDVPYGDRKPSEALRMIFYYLKAKFDAVDWGVISFEEAFLACFVGQLPDGRKVTVGEMMLPDLKKGKLPSSDIFKAPQLTEGGR
jgi:hypothetical protein